MQSLKKSVMLVLLAAFGAALAVAPAHAQSGVSANVPFDFTLGKTTLHSGQYRIVKSGSFVAVVNGQGETRFAILLPGNVHGQVAQPYLVFSRYGEQAFLNKIVISGKEVYEVPVSGQEKELRAHLEPGQQVAVLIQSGQ